jgi:uncharacterized protein with GYD domain
MDTLTQRSTGGILMATYILFGSYSHEGMRGISTDRTEKAQEIIEKFGGSVKAGYALLGRTDLVMIIDAPDTAAVMKISVALSRMSGIAFTSAPAVSFEEFDKFMEEV